MSCHTGHFANFCHHQVNSELLAGISDSKPARNRVASFSFWKAFNVKSMCQEQISKRWMLCHKLAHRLILKPQVWNLVITLLVF